LADIDTTQAPLDPAQQRNMRKVALTSLAGSSIEWYDFFLYGVAAALIFPKAFFPPDTSPMVALIASFATFGVGFVARPVGGVIFGHFGDRLGRKQMLVVALLIMGVASTAIGLLPTYQGIGLAAPILLVILRFAQGLAIGGQWGGAMLLVTESAPTDKRGWYGAYAQAGAPVGVMLANLAFLGMSAALSDEAFLSWGWRVPFVASALLIAVSIYIQTSLEDTPAFRQLLEQKTKAVEHEAEVESAAIVPPDPVPVSRARSPILEAIRLYPGKILLAAGAFLSIQVSFYILFAFVVAYGSSASGLGLPRNTMLAAVLIGSAVQIPVQFWAAAISDRFGRRKIFMTGAVLSGIWAFVMFPLLDTGSFPLITLGIMGGLAFLGLQYGPQAAFFSEMFSTHVRYSGASLGYQIGAILGGALAPTIAVLLWNTYGTFYVSLYIALAAVLSLGSVLLLAETKGADMHATPG